MPVLTLTGSGYGASVSDITQITLGVAGVGLTCVSVGWSSASVITCTPPFFFFFPFFYIFFLFFFSFPLSFFSLSFLLSLPFSPYPVLSPVCLCFPSTPPSR